jgi:hypothetical protein
MSPSGILTHMPLSGWSRSRRHTRYSGKDRRSAPRSSSMPDFSSACWSSARRDSVATFAWSIPTYCLVGCLRGLCCQCSHHPNVVKRRCGHFTHQATGEPTWPVSNTGRTPTHPAHHDLCPAAHWPARCCGAPTVCGSSGGVGLPCLGLSGARCIHEQTDDARGHGDSPGRWAFPRGPLERRA